MFQTDFVPSSHALGYFVLALSVQRNIILFPRIAISWDVNCMATKNCFGGTK